jgi:hypothetical protein
MAKGDSPNSKATQFGDTGNKRGRGRPQGSKNNMLKVSPRDLLQCRRLFTKYVTENFPQMAPIIISKTLELLEKGSEKLIMMFWDKFLLETPVTFDVSSKTAHDIGHSQGRLIKAVAKGDVSAEIGSMLIKSLAEKQNNFIVKDLESRVNAVEEAKKLS